MIRSFRDKEAEGLLAGNVPRRLRSVARVAQRKLRQLHAAHRLEDLGIFPGNRLEALKGDRRGQHSIRINDRLRICFVWRSGNAYDIEIVDYH
ncbi:MAG TPA: type II toxin-antitoxin system RelE/ParE family toxin [Vicinamibacteria bacterium]|nr:type II toxin-antitoxin system RelE/ParE family toxin [Vicinamibacteria bacterium]